MFYNLGTNLYKSCGSAFHIYATRAEELSGVSTASAGSFSELSLWEFCQRLH